MQLKLLTNKTKSSVALLNGCQLNSLHVRLCLMRLAWLWACRFFIYCFISKFICTTLAFGVPFTPLRSIFDVFFLNCSLQFADEIVPEA